MNTKFLKLLILSGAVLLSMPVFTACNSSEKNIKNEAVSETEDAGNVSAEILNKEDFGENFIEGISYDEDLSSVTEAPVGFYNLGDRTRSYDSIKKALKNLPELKNYSCQTDIKDTGLICLKAAYLAPVSGTSEKVKLEETYYFHYVTKKLQRSSIKYNGSNIAGNIFEKMKSYLNSSLGEGERNSTESRDLYYWGFKDYNVTLDFFRYSEENSSIEVKYIFN